MFNLHEGQWNEGRPIIAPIYIGLLYTGQYLFAEYKHTCMQCNQLLCVDFSHMYVYNLMINMACTNMGLHAIRMEWSWQSSYRSGQLHVRAYKYIHDATCPPPPPKVIDRTHCNII